MRLGYRSLCSTSYYNRCKLDPHTSALSLQRHPRTGFSIERVNVDMIESLILDHHTSTAGVQFAETSAAHESGTWVVAIGALLDTSLKLLASLLVVPSL